MRDRCNTGRIPTAKNGLAVLPATLPRTAARKENQQNVDYWAQYGHNIFTLIQSVPINRKLAMRFVYILLIVLTIAVLTLFKIQNLDQVTVTLFSMSATMSTSVLVVGVYILGMLTGGFVIGLIRTWFKKAMQSSTPKQP